jgi:hypothetical protein
MVRCAAALVTAVSCYLLTGEYLLTLCAPLLTFAIALPLVCGAIVFAVVAAAIFLSSGWPFAADLGGAALLALGLALWWRGTAPVSAKYLPGRLAAVTTRHPRIVARVSWVIAIALVTAAVVRGTAPIPNLAAGLAWMAAARSMRLEPASPGHRRRNVLATTLLGLSMVVFVLALVEFGARTFITTPLPSPHRSDLWVHHPRAWWVPAADLDTVGIYRDSPETFREFAVHLSPQGLRGPEIGRKRPGELRVLVAGDSYTFGWSMPEGKDFASILRSELAGRADGRPVSVVNCSAIGYGPWQERVLIEERGLPLEPDVVVLQLYPANDGWNSLAKYGRALPSYGPRMEEFVAYWRDRDHWVVRGETWLRRHSLAYHAYRTGLRDWSVGITEALSRLRFLEPYNPPRLPRRNGRPPMIEQCLAEWYPELQAGWDEMEKDVLGIVAHCRELGIPILVYTVPFPLIAKEDWDAYTAAVAAQAGQPARYEQFRDVRAAEAFLDASEIPYIPFLDSLLAEPEPDSYFIPNDGHFNEAGARFISRLIADRLSRDGFLDDRASVAPDARPGSAR